MISDTKRAATFVTALIVNNKFPKGIFGNLLYYNKLILLIQAQVISFIAPLLKRSYALSLVTDALLRNR